MERYDLFTDDDGKPVMEPRLFGAWYKAEDVDDALDALRQENAELRAAAGDHSTRWIN